MTPCQTATTTRPTTVAEVMSNLMLTTDVQAWVQAAGRTMAEWKVGALVVVDKHRPVGILTVRELARWGRVRGWDPRAVRVGEIMARHVPSTTTTATLDEALALMVARNVGHLAVLNARGALVGLLSLADLAGEASAHRLAFEETPAAAADASWPW